MEALFIILNSKAQYKYMSAFSSMLLIRIHGFLYELLIYRRFNFIMTHTHHLGFQQRVHPLGLDQNMCIVLIEKMQ